MEESRKKEKRVEARTEKGKAVCPNCLGKGMVCWNSEEKEGAPCHCQLKRKEKGGIMKSQFTQEEVAKCIVEFAEENLISPADDFTAVAGEDYGSVSVWMLPGNSGYAVRYGDGGATYYALAKEEDVKYLHEWLIPDDFTSEDHVIQVANVCGIGDVESVEEGHEGPVNILVTNYYYGPREVTSWVMDDNTGNPKEFASVAEANEWINEEEDEIYHLAHNESGHPTYTVVPAF